VRLGCSVRVILIGRVGLVRVGLGLELVTVRFRNKVKDIGSGLGSGFGLASGLLAHLAKIPQILSAISILKIRPTFRMSDGGDLTLSVFFACYCQSNNLMLTLSYKIK